RAYLRQGDKVRAAAMLEHSWRLLQANGTPGPEPPTKRLERQRAAAFWLSQAYIEAGERAKSQEFARISSRLSSKASLVESLASPALADPPDKTASAKLDALIRSL